MPSNATPTTMPAKVNAAAPLRDDKTHADDDAACSHSSSASPSSPSSCSSSEEEETKTLTEANLEDREIPDTTTGPTASGSTMNPRAETTHPQAQGSAPPASWELTRARFANAIRSLEHLTPEERARVMESMRAQLARGPARASRGRAPSPPGSRSTQEGPPPTEAAQALARARHALVQARAGPAERPVLLRYPIIEMPIASEWAVPPRIPAIPPRNPIIPPRSPAPLARSPLGGPNNSNTSQSDLLKHTAGGARAERRAARGPYARPAPTTTTTTTTTGDE